MKKETSEQLLKSLYDILDTEKSKRFAETLDSAQFSLKMNIENSSMMEDEGLTIHSILGVISNDDSYLKEFCELVMRLPINEVSVSEYCFPALWKLLELGATVKETYVGKMNNWPAEFKMIRLSLKK